MGASTELVNQEDQKRLTVTGLVPRVGSVLSPPDDQPLRGNHPSHGKDRLNVQNANKEDGDKAIK